MCRLFLTAALEALPLTVRASALPFTIFSAASPPLVGGSAVASAICLPGRLAMTKILRKWAPTTLTPKRGRNGDASSALQGPLRRCEWRAGAYEQGAWRFRKRTAAWDHGDFACGLPVGSIRVDLTAVGQ